MGKHASASAEIETHDLPLSALQREQQRLAYVLAVDNMARTLRLVVANHDALRERVDQVERNYTGVNGRELTMNAAKRVDALERDAAVGRAFRHGSFLDRLQWLLLGL